MTYYESAKSMPSENAADRVQHRVIYTDLYCVTEDLDDLENMLMHS